jgi:DNA repair protein RecO (recombination protein O)
MLAQTKGIVLKTTKYSEADLIVTLLAANGTRLQLFGRNAIKSKKRFGGGILEPTHYIQVSYEDRRSRLGGDAELHTLREAVLIEDFTKIRTDYMRLEVALELLRIVGRFVRHGDFGSAELFNLLGNSLKAAETSSDLAKLRVHFEIRLLASQGVLELDEQASRLAGLPIEQHDSMVLADVDWRGLGKQSGVQIRSFLESGSVDTKA